MLLSLGALAACSLAGAQGSGALVVNACQDAAERELRGPHPEADTVRFSRGAQLSQVSLAETSVRGAGYYLDVVSDDWKGFTFRCTYNSRSRETHDVTVRVENKARRRPAPTLTREPTQLAGTAAPAQQP